MQRFWTWPGIWLLFSWVLFFSAAAAHAQDITLEAAETAASGSKVSVRWSGTSADGDTIVIVMAGAPDDDVGPGTNAYTFGKNPVLVTAPEPVGEAEIRFVRRRGILARRKLSITPVSASVAGPASVVGGKTIEVTVSGPFNEGDIVGIVAAGAPDTERAIPGCNDFAYGRSKVRVRTPEAPGQYEIRYLRRQSRSTLARAPLTITAAQASVRGPATAVSGATISVEVSGPHGDSDLVGVVPAGAPATAHAIPGCNDFTFGKSKVRIKVPEQAGDYELRYITGASGTALAQQPIRVQAASASLQGPGKAAAGSRFAVEWQGPGNEFDQIVIAAKGDPDDRWAVADFVYDRHPLRLMAPLAVGPYELRYLTGASGAVLAREELEITPAKQEPGLLQVVASQATVSGGGAVEIILDASGSMLQRLGTARRIDIAKQTLTRLTSSVIPAGTPFALRLFGGAGGGCESRLDIPLGPLDVAAVTARVGALEAQNNAKTPIGAALESVSKDLSTVRGERLVILITDGEETCGGDPARAIRKLNEAGTAVRVNIVGFAVADHKLAATFRRWSAVGNGSYFDAQDEAGLNTALAAAIRPAYQVLDSKKQVVASGVSGADPVQLLPGTYTVRLEGPKRREKRVSVKAKEKTSVDF